MNEDKRIRTTTTNKCEQQQQSLHSVVLDEDNTDHVADIKKRNANRRRYSDFLSTRQRARDSCLQRRKDGQERDIPYDISTVGLGKIEK
jgi:hypothetical protein